MWKVYLRLPRGDRMLAPEVVAMAFVEEVPVASSWVSHPYLGGDAVKAASKAALVLAGDELRLSYFDLSAFR